MNREGARVSVAVVAALAVAQAAVLLLRPRDGVLTPAPVDPGSYFTTAERDRGRAFSRAQLALHGGSLAVDLLLLGYLVARPPRRLRRRWARPVAATAGAGAALSFVLEVVPLPLRALARRRAVEVGLATQSWGGWLADVGKAGAIGVTLAGAGAAGAVGLLRRFPRGWWLVGSAGIAGFGVLATTAAPVALEPLFNRFDPLPAGQTRDDVLALARAAGVEVGEVYAVDASRRTTAANAYVSGLGATKRVVLFDTLLASFSRDEVRLVVAHELAHVRHRDVARGLVYLALVAPMATLAAGRLARRLAPEPTPGPALVPALALATMLTNLTVGTVAKQLSRRIEVRADVFALVLTAAPEPFISFERRITLRNVSDPAPPAWVTALLATHPPTIERIGLAEAFSRRERQPADRRTPEGS